jgi:hypothetical protein
MANEDMPPPGIIQAPYVKQYTDDIVEGNIYVIRTAAEGVVGHLMLLKEVQPEFDEDIYPAVAYGRGMGAHSSVWQEWGIYSDTILCDYTEYMRQYMAANKIQQHWKLYKKKKWAVQVVENAFLDWKTKKNEVWNPATICGIVDMFINFLRLSRIDD